MTVFWAGILAIVLLVGMNYGLWNAIGMTSDTFQTLANLVLAALGTLGVINNPTDSNNV